MERIYTQLNSVINSNTYKYQHPQCHQLLNYLKIENVFQGRLLDTQELFSLEVAVATYQTNVTADFFIKGIAEIESDLVAEITNVIVDTTAEQLTTVEGRILITEKIKSELNNYLVEEDYNPDIHFVYIINYNII